MTVGKREAPEARTATYTAVRSQGGTALPAWNVFLAQKRHRALRFRLVLMALTLVLLALCVFSLGIGRVDIPTETVVRILLSSLGERTAEWSDSSEHWRHAEWVIVTEVRLPRILIAAVAGMGLGLSGAVLQGVFRNPLVGPDIIGVTHGAAFGGVCTILLGMGTMLVVFNAMLGGLLALTLCFLMAGRSGRNHTFTLVLSGLVISAFFGACIGAGQYLADPELELQSIVYWLLGSFAGANWPKLGIISLPFALASPLLIAMGWRLNVLSLDAVDAAALGVKVAYLRWLMIVLVTLILAAQVAVSGSIGWVGIVVPHFARMLFGADHRFLLPASTVLGGIYMVLIDGIARTAPGGQDLPIGILTALVGTPIFAWLFIKSRRRGWKPD